MIKDSYRINEKPGTYIYYARDAAKNEQRGDYAQAADAWRLSELRALNPVNQAFAKARVLSCQKALSEQVVNGRVTG